MRLITIIGHFGNGKEFFDGQTVKTKIIAKELKNRYGDHEIGTVDTHGGVLTALKAPYHVITSLKKSSHVLIMPANHGLRVYVPLLRLINRFYKRNLHYIVIGGWLPEFLNKHKSLIKGLKGFQGIYVETSTMKKSLDHLGLNNVFVMPNCKELIVLNKSELVFSHTPPYKVCTFSRVMAEKGIEDAVHAVIEVNKKFGSTKLKLDIYGQIDSQQEHWFEELKSSFPDYIQYAGIVPYNQSVETLKDYFALLFPTHYGGEGFAGTLIDAMAAGVPVIASDWRYNSELVHEGETGYLYRTFHQEELIDRLVWAVTNPNELNGMRETCIKKASNYHPSNAIQILCSNLNTNKQ